MAKKKKSKFKKILKKLGKVAALGGAAYGASKLFGGSRPSGFLASGAAGGANLPRGDRSARAKRLMTTNDAYLDDTMPSHLSHSMGPYRSRRKPADLLPHIMAGESEVLPYFKKGGRVTGAAKRGFGRALMKGKK